MRCVNICLKTLQEFNVSPLFFLSILFIEFNLNPQAAFGLLPKICCSSNSPVSGEDELPVTPDPRARAVRLRLGTPRPLASAFTLRVLLRLPMCCSLFQTQLLQQGCTEQLPTAANMGTAGVKGHQVCPLILAIRGSPLFASPHRRMTFFRCFCNEYTCNSLSPFFSFSLPCDSTRYSLKRTKLLNYTSRSSWLYFSYSFQCLTAESKHVCLGFIKHWARFHFF